MSQPILIRDYQPSDIPTLIELYYAGIGGKGQKSIEKFAKKAMQEFEEAETIFSWRDPRNPDSKPCRSLWVAEETATSKVVGMVGLKTSLEEEGHFELVRLSVDSNTRKLGVGRRLVSHLEEAARVWGGRRIFLTTLSTMVAARELYKSMGYQEGKSIPIVAGLDLVEMWKDLAQEDEARQ